MRAAYTLSTRHVRMVLSKLELARVLPSGAKVTHSTCGHECRWRCGVLRWAQAARMPLGPSPDVRKAPTDVPKTSEPESDACALGWLATNHLLM